MSRICLLGALVAGCASAPSTMALSFTPDPGSTGSERYLCFGFDASMLAGADLGGLVLDPPRGPVTLHHVALYASSVAFPAGPVACETMPADAVSLHVWALASGDLMLPGDLALAIPDRTVTLIVQAHSLRIDDGAAAERTVQLTPRRDAARRAGWLPLRVPTPAIGPHQRITSSASCKIDRELHVISTWPHMHRIGAEFHGSAAGRPLIDIVPFVYDAQRAYDVDALAEPGDTIDSACTWANGGDTTVLPGSSITDEMCEQSLIVWPVEAAHCS